MKIHKIVGIIVVVVAIGIITFNASQPRNPAVIKVGFVLPLTEFGAAWGIEQKRAVEIAVEEINVQGGILGKRLEVIYEDGKCDAKTATAAAQKLTSIDHVNLLVSACSAETLAAGRVADANGTVLLAAWSTNPQISGMSEYVFRNSYSDEDSARILAEDMNVKYKSVGIITELGDYSSGMKEAFKKYYKRELYDEDALPHATDVRTQIQKILSHNPEAIFVNANEQGSAIAILNQLSQRKYTGALYGNYVGSIPEVREMPISKGLLYPADPEIPDNAAWDALFKTYKEKYGEPTFNFAVAVTYDSIYILKKAIEDTKSTDSEKIKDYLHSLKDFNGVLGTYGFNEKGDVTGYQPELKQI